jgi:predicted RNA binding protein YcfA (HicA-like mRNA interferase family)
MSKPEKLVEQFLRDPPEVRFEDVYYLLSAFGFQEMRSKVSHDTFRRGDGTKITVPKKGGKMVKGIYIKQIIALLNLEEEIDDSGHQE